MRKMMSEYLKNNGINIKNGTDVNSIMRDMMSVLLEGALDEELNQELGYTNYDYRNKDTDNSRKGYSSKAMHTSYGDMEIAIPVTEKANTNHSLSRSIRIPLHMIWKKKYFCVCKRHDHQLY